MQIFIAGDSTAAQKLDEKRPESGWGEHLQPLCHSGVVVRNHAINGRSTKSFIDEGRLEAIEREIGPGDWLVIQFGHNDEKAEDPARFTEPYGAYQQNLTRYVEVARAAGATPLLLTSITRRQFDGDTLARDTVGPYPEAMRQLAGREGVALVDMYTATWQYVNALGVTGSRAMYLHLAPGENPNYPDGVQDDTHLNLTGAARVAALFAEQVKKMALPSAEAVLL